MKSSYVLFVGVFVVVNLDLLCSLFHADMSHSLVAVENLGDLFEGEALGFWEHEIHPNSFDEVPKLETQSISIRTIKNSHWSSLTV